MTFSKWESCTSVRKNINNLCSVSFNCFSLYLAIIIFDYKVRSINFIRLSYTCDIVFFKRKLIEKMYVKFSPNENSILLYTMLLFL